MHANYTETSVYGHLTSKIHLTIKVTFAQSQISVHSENNKMSAPVIRHPDINVTFVQSHW